MNFNKLFKKFKKFLKLFYYYCEVIISIPKSKPKLRLKTDVETETKIENCCQKRDRDRYRVKSSLVSCIPSTLLETETSQS